ncbi:MAG: cbb3-type cytochrome c oxidase subunit I [Chloroflexi bacterium]|nr:cbb3-type cytochrome c oxidase subunit I [Chloroflexota bacterium]
MSTQAYEITPKDKNFIGWHLAVAIIALAIGSLFGPLQAFEHAGWDLYKYLNPLIKSYYQGLTLHGVLNALVWTTFFITGFLTFTVIYGFKRPLKYPTLNLIGFLLMVVGLVLAAIPILLNEATVLFTFYPPMKANWAFYVGLTLVVVGSWVEGWGFFYTYAAWRKENPGVRTPFIAFGSIITMLLWQIATIGIAVDMLTMLIPWSLGLLPGVDPQLSRTYFWFTGHPLVYFWLLPAYISWYAMLPKQVGGKMFSDSLARFAFWLFLILSVPLGFHHQYVDPGVPPAWKFIHAMLTFSVFFPSMLTAFTVVASLEYGARQNGGKGMFGWMRALPWSNPSVAAQLLAGLLFFFGGIGGLANASYNVNLVLHNTAFVPGHFHLTVGTGVTLTFIGISYWLIPYLTGKKLWQPKWAVAQAWLWFVGMIIFSNSMHILGLLGAPRRTPLNLAPYIPAEWNSRLFQVGIGGAILFVSGAIYLTVVAATFWSKQPATEKVEVPVAEALQDPALGPAWLDRWTPWVVATLALIVLAYGPMLFDLIKNIALTSPGFRVW